MASWSSYLTLTHDSVVKQGVGTVKTAEISDLFQQPHSSHVEADGVMAVHLDRHLFSLPDYITFFRVYLHYEFSTCISGIPLAFLNF